MIVVRGGRGAQLAAGAKAGSHILTAQSDGGGREDGTDILSQTWKYLFFGGKRGRGVGSVTAPSLLSIVASSALYAACCLAAGCSCRGTAKRRI